MVAGLTGMMRLWRKSAWTTTFNWRTICSSFWKERKSTGRDLSWWILGVGQGSPQWNWPSWASRISGATMALKIWSRSQRKRTSTLNFSLYSSTKKVPSSPRTSPRTPSTFLSAQDVSSGITIRKKVSMSSFALSSLKDLWLSRFGKNTWTPRLI